MSRQHPLRRRLEGFVGGSESTILWPPRQILRGLNQRAGCGHSRLSPVRPTVARPSVPLRVAERCIRRIGGGDAPALGG
jgi:hypothetical protein